MASKRSTFGQVVKLPSGRYRARYTLPGRAQQWINAPATFTRKADATAWLARQRTEIEDGVVRPKAIASKVTLEEYAEQWLDGRRNSRGEPLRPSTRRVYEHYLQRHVYPVMGATPLPKITPEVIESWHANLLLDRPTLRARTYSLLRTILGSAVPKHLPTNPCYIRGGGGSRPATKTVIATPAQVLELRAAMPERLALAVLLGAWVQLRNGEALELRRRDVTADAVVVTRGVTWSSGKATVGPPKTDAGVRAVALPPHIADAVRAHLEQHANPGPNGLLFPAKPGRDEHLHSSTFAYFFKEAVKRTSLPGTFRYHWLRHTGLTLAAQTGATIAELQARAGHSTPSTVMRYQHATGVRDRTLADALSALATGGSAPG